MKCSIKKKKNTKQKDKNHTHIYIQNLIVNKFKTINYYSKSFYKFNFKIPFSSKNDFIIDVLSINSGNLLDFYRDIL